MNLDSINECEILYLNTRVRGFSSSNQTLDWIRNNITKVSNTNNELLLTREQQQQQQQQYREHHEEQKPTSISFHSKNKRRINDHELQVGGGGEPKSNHCLLNAKLSDRYYDYEDPLLDIETHHKLRHYSSDYDYHYDWLLLLLPNEGIEYRTDYCLSPTSTYYEQIDWCTAASSTTTNINAGIILDEYTNFMYDISSFKGAEASMKLMNYTIENFCDNSEKEVDNDYLDIDIDIDPSAFIMPEGGWFHSIDTSTKTKL